MTTVVTGAGLIGTSFAQLAIARNESVVFIDPLPRDDYLRRRLRAGSYDVVTADIRNMPAVLDVLRGSKADKIVHTAALIGERAANPLYEGVSLNVLGTISVVEAARLAGIKRFVQVSTFGVYDWRRPTPEPLTEAFPRGSGAAYGNFKVTQELLLEVYQKSYGFELVLIRPANVFGIGHFWGGSGGGEKIQNMIIAGLRGSGVTIPQEQTMAFEYVYSKDVGRAVDLAATAKLGQFEIFNIGSAVTTPFDLLVATIKDRLPGLSVTIAPGRTPVSRLQHLDISHAAAVLGWSPTYNLGSGMDDYIDELRSQF